MMGEEARTVFGCAMEQRLPHEKEVRRIQKKLGEHLSPERAREAAAAIYDLALDVDEEIARILRDPLVDQMFEYDGLFFTPRGTHLFHRAFNGINILKSLNNQKIDIFFYGKKKKDGLEWMMHELGTHTWEVTVRRMNWEESGSLSVLSREVIEAVVEDVTERRRQAAASKPQPPTPEEQTFFQTYEHQMGKPDSKSLPGSGKK